jgi:maleate isomerase
MSRQRPQIASAPHSSEGWREYGRAGLFGLLTPQGNPTAEPELKILLPGASALLAARLRSSSPVFGQRLIDYWEQLGELVDHFDNIALDAVGFACTGSSYGIEPDAERRRTEEIETRKGYPIVTAAEATRAAFEMLGIGAIALVSPYPAWLTDACRTHWQRHGVRVIATLQLPVPSAEAHRIYGLTTPEVLQAVADFDLRGAEAILLAGTGMPSLRSILALEAERAVPVLSSNLCLAWALARITGAAGPGPESPLYGGWTARLACS